jgi:hypothetical protein
MIFRNRVLAGAGAGAVGLLAAGVLAAPAFADNSADLEVRASGTTIALGASGKNATVSLINNSTVDAKGILVGLDIRKLDTTLVEIDESGCNEREDGFILCGINGDTIGAGQDVDWAFPLTRKGAASGSAGQLTVFIEHEGTDPAEKNNAVTVDVTVGGNGPDLAVVAPDVTEGVTVDGAGNLQATGKLHAGGTAALRYFVANQGDAASHGLTVKVTLPKGVTFTENEPGCELAADRSSALCTYNGFGLVPADQDTDAEDEVFSAYGFYHLVSVSADTKAGSLTGGAVSVEPIVVSSARGGKAPAELPANVEGARAAEVDASDNSDTYAVVVAAKGGTGGGGTGGGDGDGGGLPVTGPQAGLIGGIGVVALAAGGAMFLAARRRRVVLVTPGDEKSIV